MAPPDQPTLEASKLINSRDDSPLLHTRSYLGVGVEIISLMFSHSSTLFHHKYTEPAPY